MAKNEKLSFMVIFLLVNRHNTALATHSPQNSPAPAPQIATATIPPESGAPVQPPTWSPTTSPAKSPVIAPSALPISSPGSPSPMPSTLSISPVPAPVAEKGDLIAARNSKGMSSGKKAGIAVGVIAGVALLGFASFVFMKRQKNVRRTQYGNLPRRDIL